MSLQSRLTTKCPHLEYMISILNNTLSPCLDNCICPHHPMTVSPTPTAPPNCSLPGTRAQAQTHLNKLVLNSLSCLVYWWEGKMLLQRPRLQWVGRPHRQPQELQYNQAGLTGSRHKRHTVTSWAISTVQIPSLRVIPYLSFGEVV